MIGALLISASAAAFCEDGDDAWLAAPTGTLPAHAAPWVVPMPFADRRHWHLFTRDGKRVPAVRLGRTRIRLVPLVPLRPGEIYEVRWHTLEGFSFEVETARDTGAPVGGEPLAWVRQEEWADWGPFTYWTVAVVPLDERAWWEVEVRGRDEAPVRFFGEVRQLPADHGLAVDWYRASFASDVEEQLGRLPDAVIQFASIGCGVPAILRGKPESVVFRVRYFDAGGNVSAWSVPVPFGGG